MGRNDITEEDKKREEEEKRKEKIAKLYSDWKKCRTELDKITNNYKKLENDLRLWKLWYKKAVHEKDTREEGKYRFGDPPGTENDFYSHPYSITTSDYGTARTFSTMLDFIRRGDKQIEITKDKVAAALKKVNDKRAECVELWKKYWAFKNNTEYTPPETTPGDGDNDSNDSNNENSGSNQVSGKDAKKIKYKYNIPMVKSAYYQKGLKHLQMVLAKNPNWTLKDNGRKMWLGGASGKGVIQADAQYSVEHKNKEWKDVYGNDIKKQQLYGMRFSYNPMTVDMDWGVVQEVEPSFVASGLDKATALAPALLQSTITFKFYINRIEDMNHINAKGWRGGDENPWPTKESPATFNDDLKEIYKRGTMYDLEHLFAAQYPANPFHKSTLNGMTSDWGWLTGYACELHLGAGLRYRVRISGLHVTHIMFNERMVPVLTEVQVTAARYPDIKQTKAYKDAAKKAKESADGGKKSGDKGKGKKKGGKK